MIVVFGSLNADLVFPVGALPREGETVACEAVLLMPGGKGANQAVAAARAGALVRMAGCVGGDPFGDLLVGSLEEAGVGLDALERVAAPTGCAAVIVDSEGRNQIAIAGGANLEAKASQVKDGDLGPETTVLVQNEVRPEENRELVRRAGAAGARVLFNAAPAGRLDADMLQSVDCPPGQRNRGLPCRQGGRPRRRGPDRGGARPGRRLWHGVRRHHGRRWRLRQLAQWQVAGRRPSPSSRWTRRGPSDAFVGVFAASLDAGLNAADALHRASVAGSLACLTEGAQPSLPSAADIEQRLAGLAPVRRL